MVYARYWSMDLFTFFKGHLKGKDTQGNKYYEERFLFKKPKNRKPRRWVIYAGILEGSCVSAEWFGWLHYSLDAPLDAMLEKPWQKPSQPNQTGTPLAYRPPGVSLKEGSSCQGYKAWDPSL